MRRLMALCFCALFSCNAHADKGLDIFQIMAGVGSGYAAHEGAHYLAAKAAGADDIHFTFDSFSYNNVSEDDDFRIASAGFVAQNMLAEIALDMQEHKRVRSYALGVLLWNTGEEVSYVMRRNGTHDDLATMSEHSGISRTAMWAFLSTKSVVDLYRWYYPESRWAPWVSRAGLGAMVVGITTAFR